MSSHNTIYYGRSKDKASSSSKNSALRKIPNDPTYAIDQFVGRGGQVVSPPQHQSSSSERAEMERRSIAARQARASALLQAFDTQFSRSNRPPKQ
ncbi:hypothetical protein MKX08_008221 [Trichoderma sp. CBMAI-0020]|nr:hypothetical protein MKX08_008221 [Trichoderma sp. CBMAI-0020]WOD46340.1 hypothetical protein [Trichoderma atroviride]